MYISYKTQIIVYGFTDPPLDINIYKILIMK